MTTSFYRTADLPFAAPSGSGTSAPPAEEQRMVLERTREDLEQVLGRELPATAAWRIQRWDDVIPRYAPGHAERIAAFAGELAAAAPRIHLTGNYLAGVGVEAVVGHARALAARLAAKP